MSRIQLNPKTQERLAYKTSVIMVIHGQNFPQPLSNFYRVNSSHILTRKPVYLNPKRAEMEIDFINSKIRGPWLQKEERTPHVPRTLIQDLFNMCLKRNTKQILVMAHNHERERKRKFSCMLESVPNSLGIHRLGGKQLTQQRKSTTVKLRRFRYSG
jgi:hypothetical protein